MTRKKVVTTLMSCTPEITQGRRKVVTAEELDVFAGEESPVKKHPIDGESVGANVVNKPRN